jgi:hypothetical protein
MMEDATGERNVNAETFGSKQDAVTACHREYTDPE